MKSKKETLGWGRIEKTDTEIWDTDPVFLGDTVGKKDWLKLLFYPKKFFLYRHIKEAFDREMEDRNISEPFRILDVGCGTGATVIDLKKMFGRRADVVGIDVVQLQIEIGQKKLKKHGVNVELEWYGGEQFPFSNNSFDAVYTSDVLGHVRDVPEWLAEIYRVLKPGGTLAMFSESELGRHALVRNYLSKRGLNVDPHAEFHISLYSKQNLQDLIANAGFEIEKMLGAFLAAFLVHPDEFYPKLSQAKGFFFLKNINRLLTFIKKKTHPVSPAVAEIYGLFEMSLFGKWLEGQSYVILGRSGHPERSETGDEAD